MKKITALILSAVFMLCIASCGSQSSSLDNDTASPAVLPAVSQSPEPEVSPSGTRTVTDVWGREAEIPADVESIICLGSGAPRIAAYLDVMDMLTGIEESDAQDMTVLRDYNPVYHEAVKSLPIVGAGGGSGNNNGYPEEIIMLSPDVILAGFTAEAADELQAQTNIPVVAVRYISTGLANDTFYSAMRVFAETVGAEERCEAVLTYIDDCKADLNNRTSGVPDDAKLKAYSGAVTFSGKHGFTGTYSKFGPFVLINAKNVADEVSEEGYYETDFEKIITWDPDVIFLDPANMGLVNDEYSSNPKYFETVRAVTEGNVYTMPSFNYAGTNISYALMDSYYAGTILFPEEFADVDIAEKSDEILTFFLGENTYGLMAENGLYYGKITIGD